MKEQWKKLDDNDAKLLVNVEEGKQVPIKIDIPLSALTPPKDEFCCNRLLIILKVCVLLALLILLGWSAATVFNDNNAKTIPVDKENLENKFAFQSLVYKNKDALDTNEGFKKPDSEAEEFRDSTKKALDQINAEMKAVNDRLNRMQVEKEQQKMEIGAKILDDAKLVDDDEVVAAEQTLDSMFDELAKEVGLPIDNVDIEQKPGLDAVLFTETSEDDLSDLQKKLEQQASDFMSSWLKNLNIENSEETGFQIQLVSDVAYQPDELTNKVLNERANEEVRVGEIIGDSYTEEVVQTAEEAHEDFSEKVDRIRAQDVVVRNIDDSHEEDKHADQVLQAMINRIAASNLDNDNEEELTEKEDKVEGELIEEQDRDVEINIMDDLVNELLDTLFDDSTDETATSEKFENVEESHNEDKVEQEMMDQIDQDFQAMIEGMADTNEMVNDPENAKDIETSIFETSSEHKSTEDELGSSLLDEILNFIVEDDKPNNLASISEEKSSELNFYTGFLDQEISTFPSGESEIDVHEIPIIIPEEPSIFSENKEININDESAPIQESPSTEKSLIELVPSVEYVKKIEENPFIPRVAKMLEPIVGQNHELLVWYYTHKDLPDYLRGADKWKVFGAKLLYDSNIKDYPADATIVSGLTFEKVYGGAEYPSSSEEIQSELQQEIINRLILKSYLNKMLLEGNAEADTLSQVIEQNNQEKLKELDIDPKELSYRGDFFEVDDSDLIIPVVKFDPFVDESKEANEQRVQVIKAFERTRDWDDVILKPTYEKYSFFDSTTDAEPEKFDQSELLAAAPIVPESDESKKNSEELIPSEIADEFVMNSKSPETIDGSEWYMEFLPKEQPSTELSSEEVNEEKTSVFLPEEVDLDYY